MKKAIITSCSLMGIALSMSILASNGKHFKEVFAYDESKVATTIDLNDCEDAEIRSYYSALDNLSDAELSGTNLLKNLKPILKNNQKYFSYGSSATTKVWQIYEIIDRDWELSPAKDIEGYNASTNKIEGYTYGSSNKQVGSNPYIHALYVNRNVPNQNKAWGNHNQDDWGINQEHVWPKSAGFEDDAYPTGARGDVMHLWAGNGRVNGQYHNNYYYGFVDTERKYDDAGKDSKNYTNLTGNLKGFSKTLGGDVTVFEPQDSDKGDIARSIFYMAARYNFLSGSDSDGINSSNPNLEIVNDLTSFQKSGYSSTTTNTGKMGILQDLLQWNKIDPVDEFEIHRNNLVYRNYTNNRNPFIDFPQWADYIWGTSENGVYNSNPTGKASPKNDSIAKDVISISKKSISLKPNETATISATNKDNVNITWTVSDDSVISISKTTSTSGEEITITALKEGTAKLTAKVTIDGKDYIAECTITVANKKTIPLMFFIIGGAAALVLFILVILFFKFASKKQKHKAKKYATKTVKKYTKTTAKSKSNSRKR